MSKVGVGLLWAGVLGAVGCGTTTMQATARQPNPLLYPGATLRESEKLHIELRDMELPRFVMRNTAYFNVVSRDRLRFHVTFVHKWQEMTDVREWDVYLEDDRGRRYAPEHKEHRASRHLTRMDDIEHRTGIYSDGDSLHGDLIGSHNDAYRRRTKLSSEDMFRGDGDLVFYKPNLIDRDVRRLALVMRRSGVELRYVWEFSDGEVQIKHYRSGRPGRGNVIQPGPLTNYQ